MTTYYLNGIALVEGADITINGFTYPYSWLEGTSQQVRASHGIEKTGDVNYDPRYYWFKDIAKNLEDKEENNEDGTPAYVKVWDPTAGERGEMVDSDKRMVTKGLKTGCLSEIRSTTNNLLKPTDYYIIRNAVEQVEIPTSVSEYRTAVIAEQDRVVTAISSVTTVEQLIEVMGSINWPRAD
jgi:hypothetical protein